MLISFDDARLILTKWKEDSVSVVLFSELPGARLVLTGKIHDVLKNELQFLCKRGSQVSVWLKQIRFEYGDPREVADVVHRGTYNSFLHLRTENEAVTYMLFEATEEHLSRFGIA